MQGNSSNPQRLDRKVALITGAAGGIGGATARLFLSLGARLMLVDRDERALAHIPADDDVATSVADCADETAMEAAVGETLDRFGKIDILVANAGIEGVLKPIDQLSSAEFENVLRINVLGVWLAMRQAVPAMKAAGGGAIVALSSVAGTIGFPGMAAYTASKHAVLGLVKVAALELAAAHIRVNAVAPGPVDNRMMQSLGDQLGGGDPSGFRTFIESRVPMGRYGTNEEIAQLVAFLASDAASYCTGGLYLGDGGYVAA
ncbi:MAG TPA: SDR family NAD(P)-dependent oxidoreductase [Sphingomicrobium sp.]|jgi:NAD(P)-dependent dehydrogenase (short-subunit alcohol dehydrogenase family)